MSDNTTGLTVTLKAGVGFEAPWIVIHAADAADALRQIDTGEFATLAERTVSAAAFFRAAHTGKTAFPQAKTEAVQDSGPGWSQQGSQQQAPQSNAPQAGGSHHCVHGPRERKVLKKGTPEEYVGYFCPLPKGGNSCKPEWAKVGQ